MDSIAAQVNGQYVVPEQVQMTAQVSALTIGQVLDESEPATGHRRQVFIDGEKCSIHPFSGSNFCSHYESSGSREPEIPSYCTSVKVAKCNVPS